jgi:hypothetical protein
MTAPRLEPGEIRAGRRPGVIAVTYLMRAAFGLVLVWPACEIFARAAMAHPREDAILFDPGGLLLLEAFRLGRGALAGALRGASFTAAMIFAFGLLPLGALMYALGHGGTIRASDLAAAAVRFFGRLAVLLVMATLGMALAVVLSFALATALKTKVAPALPDPAGDALVAGAWLVGAVLVAILGVVHDLARAAVTQRDLGAVDGVRVAMRAASARPAAAFFGWAWRSATGAMLVVVVAFAAAAVGTDRFAALGAAVFLHQACVLGIVALRASWLACAIRLSEAAFRDLSGRQASEELFVAAGRAVPTDVQTHDPAP